MGYAVLMSLKGQSCLHQENSTYFKLEVKYEKKRKQTPLWFALHNSLTENVTVIKDKNTKKPLKFLLLVDFCSPLDFSFKVTYFVL